jgi:hypothetical protein
MEFETQAGIVSTRMSDPATLAEERADLKSARLQCCELDTLALACILEALLQQTRTSAG